MVTALQAGEIDMAVGLTEGWISGICKAQAASQNPGFKLVGTYVNTPLRWAISTGPQREDLKSIKDLEGAKVGVSRIGSGSYVMSYVLARQQGWLNSPSASNSNSTSNSEKEKGGQEKETTEPPFPVTELQTFARLRNGVIHQDIDFFMWEYFTSKKYYDDAEIKHIGDVYSPWKSWMIVAADHLLHPSSSTNRKSGSSEVLSEELEDALLKINKGVAHFKENQEEAVKYISTELDYSEEDARAWLGTVEFPGDVRGADEACVRECVEILGTAGVVKGMPEFEGLIALSQR